MPAVPSWNEQFTLTNPYNGTMLFNIQTADGLYLLDRATCKFNISVRETTDNVPQANGYILHEEFLTGTQMPLRIYLMQDEDKIACDDLLATMLDELSGAFRSLLNAGDNEGRLSWLVSGKPERMLDDIRLLVYPDFGSGEAIPYIDVSIHSQYPYAEDLAQTRTGISDGSTVTLTNTGTADFSPVFQINRLNGVTGGSPVTDFVLQNLTTGDEIIWDDAQPGANPIPGSHYGEIDTFRNTFFLDGDSSNEDAGISQLESEYFVLVPGANQITIAGCDTDVLFQAAWA